MKRIMLTSVVLLGVGLFANAQNFSGTWVLQSKEHVQGPEYGNAIQSQMTVTQTKDSLIIETTNMGAGGQDVKSRNAFANNGKASVVKSASSGRKYTMSAGWSADKKTMTLTTLFSVPGYENETDFTRVETWILSADGKQINIDKKSIETRSEAWEVKGVFAKQ